MTPTVAATATNDVAKGAAGAQGAGNAGFDHSVAATQQADRPGTGTRVDEASLESRGNGVQASGSPPEKSVRAGQPSDPVGHQVLDRLDALHNYSKTMGRMGGVGTANPNEPELKVAAQLPGPAQTSPVSADSDKPKSAPGSREDADDHFSSKFNEIADYMNTATNYTVEASMVSKTGDSFTNSVKQLISSN